jgi:N-acetyltransferase
MIPFPDDLVLEDERALLRPLQKSDLDFLLPFAENEPEIWSYAIISPAGRMGMEEYIGTAVGQRLAKKEFPFIVFDKTAGAYAGSSRFYDIQLPQLAVQLGYTWYGKKFQRTGLNRHCKWLMLSYAFETLGMERVEFRADANNQRSIQAMKAIGCVEEGILRSTMPVAAGGRRNSIVLSILKEEWFHQLRDKLAKKIYS